MGINKKVLLSEIMQLPPDERLELIGDVWDSLDEQDMPPLSEAQLLEVRRRLEEHRQDPGSALPWEEVRDRLQSRLK